MKVRRGVTKESTNMTQYSDINSYTNTARMEGHNTKVGNGIWSLSSRLPTKPYQAVLKDAFPRNEYTMMHQLNNAPKYYDGKFVTFDYKDNIQPPTTDTSRPVVFKSQNIESIQTRKKYGQNLKGVSSVPLHLCNDTTSELFQRSLNPDMPRDRSHLTTGSSRLSELSQLRSRFPKDFQLPTHTKNEISPLHPLGYSTATQRWINTTYPAQTRHDRAESGSSKSSRYFGVKDQQVTLGPRDLRSGKVLSEPEWYSDKFPTDRVANALKFMGESQAGSHKTPRKREYDINFG